MATKAKPKKPKEKTEKPDTLEELPTDTEGLEELPLDTEGLEELPLDTEGLKEIPTDTEGEDDNESIYSLSPISLILSIALLGRDIRMDDIVRKFSENPTETKELPQLVRTRYLAAIKNRGMTLDSYLSSIDKMSAAIIVAIRSVIQH
jgi:hypothetical protein